MGSAWSSDAAYDIIALTDAPLLAVVALLEIERRLLLLLLNREGEGPIPYPISPEATVLESCPGALAYTKELPRRKLPLLPNPPPPPPTPPLEADDDDPPTNFDPLLDRTIAVVAASMSTPSTAPDTVEGASILS